MMVAPEGVTEEPLLVAAAPVKVTVPKSAKGTREPLDSKSSTIHSALYSHSWFDSPLKEWVTVLPVETFSTVAVPADLLDAVTVILMTFPDAMVMPLKSYA